jgi:hypothetical protein
MLCVVVIPLDERFCFHRSYFEATQRRIQLHVYSIVHITYRYKDLLGAGCDMGNCRTQKLWTFPVGSYVSLILVAARLVLGKAEDIWMFIASVSKSMHRKVI